MEIAEAKPLTRKQLEDLDSLSDADVFILENLTKSVKKELYDNGKVKFLAEMKEEQLDGRYQEFWENGNIKVRGKYKNGSKTGVWKFYNEDGEFDRKRRFKRGDDDEGEDKGTDSGEPDI
jgi:antitoxin component YwqK of YwqJK toxin-antitoxin module